jgi:hypothetical protein
MLYMRESPSDVSNHDVTLVLCRVDMKANQHACAALERASVVLHISAVCTVLLIFCSTLLSFEKRYREAGISATQWQ